MGRLVYYGLSCRFCGFQCSRGEGFMAPSGSRRTMLRCVDCGTALCERCVDKEHNFTLIGTTAKIGLAAITYGTSLLFTGLRNTEIKCLSCGSKNIKEVSSE